MPPPAPIKPQMKPITAPQATDWTSRLRGDTASMASRVVMTGLTKNFTPSSRVMNMEKLPMVPAGTRLDAQLPARVKTSTVPIITRPFFTSRFLFLP